MLLDGLGAIGNCQYSSLIDQNGAVVWCCWPRFDSAPVFAELLDGAHGGCFRIGPAEGTPGTQRYLPNTNVLETVFHGSQGSFRCIDFAPRFVQHERPFRPTQMIRIVEPLEGTPRVQARCDPTLGWAREAPERVQGSNHIRFEGFPAQLRLTTDVPLAYVIDGRPFTLTQRRHFALTWGTPIEEPLAPLCDRFLHETVRYWERWVKHCNIPPFFQQQVIRSALALKLHCFEDTGAIIASMTTSLPESPGSGRTWDYRYCWLRDAAYALGAFRLLGHFEEREKFVTYLLDVIHSSPSLDLVPVYRVDGGRDLEEQIVEGWPGYEGNGPVRIGNGAVAHSQHDIYGEVVLALAPIFLDDRFSAERSAAVLNALATLTRKAVAVAGTPDASIWEYRTAWKPQTFSSLMCWAAADRMAKVAAIQRPEWVEEFRSAAARIKSEICVRAWNDERRTFVASYEGHEVDASLLQIATLRFLERDDPRLGSTIEAIQRELGGDGWLRRYRLDDGFGVPQVAFTLCTFWLVEALAIAGRQDEAKKTLDRVCAALPPLGLVSEDYDTATRRMWGNFPQAYSHVGLIHAAFAASPRWQEIL